MENVSREILTSEAIFLFPHVSSALFRILLEERKRMRKGGKEMESCGFRMVRDADRKFGKSITKISSAYNRFFFRSSTSDNFIIPRSHGIAANRA